MIGVIAAFSLWGRPLQGWLKSHVDSAFLAWGIGLALLGLAAAGLGWLFRREGGRALLHLLWVVPGLALLPYALPQVEERFHFVLFGLFGFLTLRLFPPLPGVFLCALFAGLDELLQWYLPDRVGDWRDVGINLLAALMGAFLAWRGKG